MAAEAAPRPGSSRSARAIAISARVASVGRVCDADAAEQGGQDMPGFTPPTVTLIYAAAAVIINLWLAFRTVQVRLRTKTSMGHGETDGLLLARGRAHANFNEYVPLALLLMLAVELHVGPSTGLWVLGAMLIVGRLLHPFGLERPAPNPLRMAGILLTWVASLGLAAWALLLVLRP